MDSKRSQRQASLFVRDLIQAAQSSNSDFSDLYESSGDEYRVSRAELEDLSSCSSDDEPLSKLKQRALLTTSNTETSDEDTPLIAYKMAKQARENKIQKENVPVSVVEVPAGEINHDQDLAALLPQLQEEHSTPHGFVWVRQPFQLPETMFSGQLEEPPSDGNVASPYQFFKRLVTEEMIESLTDQTNRYAMQKEGIQLNTTQKEVEIMMGIYLRMGLVQMPRVRSYWETETRFGPIADLMSRNRFEKLVSLAHFCDNLTATDEDKQNKLWKLQPWLESLRKNFLAIPAEEYNSVDEMMVAFKGKSSIKQYIRGKPNPWGFKVWARAGASGILYDFEIYQGSTKFQRSGSTVGVSGDVVLRLASTLESGKNYKLFADNYFTSVALANALKARGIWYVGTVRSNRLKGCTFKSEKEMKKQGRGSVDYRVESTSNVVAVRWYDNKTVDVISSYIGPEPVDEVRRWDKVSRSYVMIKRPKIIADYNTFMGGVDLLDSLTALYKQKMKSRRWYMYLFWHTIMVAAVNAWLWYKRHCTLLKQKPMKLCSFVSDVSSGLTGYRTKAGRPSLSPPPPARQPTMKSKKRPIDDTRQDCVSHFPIWDSKRQRCKFSGCDGFSFVKCLKCDLNLCLNKDRNCFTAFHI